MLEFTKKDGYVAKEEFKNKTITISLEEYYMLKDARRILVHYNLMGMNREMWDSRYVYSEEAFHDDFCNKYFEQFPKKNG